MPINETTLQNEEREEEEENRTEMDVEATPSKGGKSKKRVATYPEEVLTNDCYSLFLSIYRDRHSVDSLIADVVKDLKVLFFHLFLTTPESKKRVGDQALRPDPLPQRPQTESLRVRRPFSRFARPLRPHSRFPRRTFFLLSFSPEPLPSLHLLREAFSLHARLFPPFPTKRLPLARHRTQLLRSPRGNQPAHPRASFRTHHLQVRQAFHSHVATEASDSSLLPAFSRFPAGSWRWRRKRGNYWSGRRRNASRNHCSC